MSFAISDFAGSYSKKDWKDIPGDLQWEAWNLRLIDATWHCADICGADVTGANPGKRLARTQAPRMETVHHYRNSPFERLSSPNSVFFVANHDSFKH